jgi:hypothetical protein
MLRGTFILGSTRPLEDCWALTASGTAATVKAAKAATRKANLDITQLLTIDCRPDYASGIDCSPVP